MDEDTKKDEQTEVKDEQTEQQTEPKKKEGDLEKLKVPKVPPAPKVQEEPKQIETETQQPKRRSLLSRSLGLG